MKPAETPLLQDYIHEEQMAPAIGVSLRTLQRWRTDKIGPAFTRIGRGIYYKRSSIENWLKSQERADNHASAA